MTSDKDRRPWRKWYGRRWKAARADFLEKNPLCCKCGRVATVVDHRIPHKGDKKLFWDKRNWQAMCKTCHDSDKQREERSGRIIGCDANGTPFRCLLADAPSSKKTKPPGGLSGPDVIRKLALRRS